MSVDPVTADGNTGSNFNRYWYANNNPYKFKDPDGRRGCDLTRCEVVRSQEKLGGDRANKMLARADAKNSGKGAQIGMAALAAVPLAAAAAPTVAAAAATYGEGLVAVDVAGTQAGKQIAGVVANVVKSEVKTAISAAGAAAKTAEIAIKTSPITISAMNNMEHITDAIQGAIGQYFGVQSPPSSVSEMAGEQAAGAVMDATDTEPRH